MTVNEYGTMIGHPNETHDVKMEQRRGECI